MKLRIEVRNVEKPGAGAPRVLEFNEGPVQVGRSSAGHVVLDEQPISRLQMVFEEVHGAWHATHRGTAVASVLNRTPMAAERPTRVAEGDTIRIGPFELRLGVIQMTELPELRPLSDVHGSATFVTMRPDTSIPVAGAFVPLPEEDVRGARPGAAGRGVPTLFDPAAAPGTTKLEFTEVGRKYSIGRASTCDLAIANSSVSRLHAEARFDGTTAYVKDAGSRNTVRVNGRPILGETPLAPGDVVSVGPVDLTFAVDQGGGFAPEATHIDPLMTIDMDARPAAKPAPRARPAPAAAPEWSPAPVASPAPAAGGWRPEEGPAAPAWSPPAAAAPAPAPAPQPFFDAPPVRPSAPPPAAPAWDMPAAAPPPPPQPSWEAPAQGPVWNPPPVDPGPRKSEPAPQPPAPAQPPSAAPTLSPSAEIRSAPRRNSRRSGWLVTGIVCMSVAVIGGVVLMIVSL